MLIKEHKEVNHKSFSIHELLALYIFHKFLMFVRSKLKPLTTLLPAAIPAAAAYPV